MAEPTPSRRLGRRAGLDTDGILQHLFPDDQDNSDTEIMNYSSESEVEYHLDDGYTKDYQEEEREVIMDLPLDALSEIHPDDPLGPLIDQSHLRSRRRAGRSSGPTQAAEAPASTERQERAHAVAIESPQRPAPISPGISPARTPGSPYFTPTTPHTGSGNYIYKCTAPWPVPLFGRPQKVCVAL